MSTVLLVDDDASNREPIGKLLRMHGYEVVRAANGREALELLESYRVDLILLDLVMPVMDGLTFLKSLRQLPRFNQLPVVMLTALYDGQAQQRAQKLGVDAYLVKSRFSPEQLYKTIEDQLSGERDRNLLAAMQVDPS